MDVDDDNPADATMILSDEVGETLTGGGGSADDPYNFAAALGLRKNLAASFDRHVAGGDGDGGKEESNVATFKSTNTAKKKTAAAATTSTSTSTSAGAAKNKKVGGTSMAISSASAPTTTRGLAPKQLNEKPEFSPKAGGVRSRILQLENAAKVEGKKATATSSSPKRDGSNMRGGAGATAGAGTNATTTSTAAANFPKPRFGVGKKVLAAAKSATNTGAGVVGGAAAAAAGGGRPLSRPRPPMAAGGGGAHGRSKRGGGRNRNGSSSATNGREGSLLSVYLRIRPITSAVGDPSNDPGKANTIEIMPTTTSAEGTSAKGVSFKDDQDKPAAATAAAPTTTTTIRTYPPQNSNAAKVLRTHPSSDMIFHQSDATGGGGGVKEYKFNSVFGPASTQEDVYRGVAKPLVEGLFPASNDTNAAGSGDGDVGKLVGQSALLFAYGITNAGKTYTIMGKGGNSASTSTSARPSSLPVGPDMGVIPRALHDILQRVKDLGEDKYQVNLAYFEIYNEQCFDLIGPKKSSADAASSSNRSLHGPAPLKLRESRDGKIFVKGLARRKVESLEHGLGLIRAAMKKRHTSSNNINNDSSRSHSICQLDIVALPQQQQQHSQSLALSTASAADDDDVSIASGMSMASGASGYNTEDEASSLLKKEERSVSMWIVDLAGTERSKRTGTATKSTRQKEAALINSSLMKLMRCLHTLRDNQSSSSAAMVPFRESKLTHLFMNHLTGASASRTGMIVNVNPSAMDYDETQHVLSYATIAKSIVISEDDHERKRRGDHLTHTHDSNGRSLSRSKAGRVTGRSPPKKIARLAAKLSPRSMLAKRREQQADAQRRKEQLQQMRGATSSSSVSAAMAASSVASRVAPSAGTVDSADESGPKRKLAKISAGVRSSKQLQEKDTIIAQNKEEIGRLRSSLTATQNEAKVAKEESLRLREQLSQRETQIRIEISEEMETQISSMRDHYQSIVDRLKAQVGQTPGKSARKVRLDRAEMVIEELLDQVEECEEDAKRSREIHEESISNLARLHETALAEKEGEFSTLKSYYEKVIVSKEKEIATLRAEKREVEASKEQMVAEYEALLEDEREIRELSALPSSKSPAPSSVRRLRRDRTSDVACTNAPPTPPRSQSKKKGGGLFSGGKTKSARKQKVATPLSTKSCNNTRDSVESEFASVHDEDSSYSEYD